MDEHWEPVDRDVVIVGAGPTGMTAAALLSARGLTVTVLEQRDSTSTEPKAISLDDEALRVYQQAGIVDDVLGIIVPGTGTRYYDLHNEPLFQGRTAVPLRLGYPFKNPFAQPDLERVLADALLCRDNVDLRFGVKVVGLEQNRAGVRIHAESPAGPVDVRARFVLGADGGRSVVRELLGIEMTGRSFPDVWLVADTLGDPHTERYGMHHGDPLRPHVIVPGMDGRCRYEFLLFPGEGEAGPSADFDLLRRLVSPYRDIKPAEVERAVNYTFNALNASRWRQERVFLLGDAAHMMPPFAGQGLNSGLRDAANLAWKIAEVTNGSAPDSILDSYEAERKPHAEATIRLSVRLRSVVMTTSLRAAANRDRAVRSALETVEGRAFFEEMRYRPLAHYGTGVVLDGQTELTGVAIGQPQVFDAGARLVKLLDEATGKGWSVIGVDINADEWGVVQDLAALFGATQWHVPFGDTMPRELATAGVLVDMDGGLYREFEPYCGCFVLLRPDHFTAAVWHPADTATVAEAVAAWRTMPASAPSSTAELALSR